MKIHVSDLEKIINTAKSVYGPDAIVSLCMDNDEEFYTGWYDTFEKDGIQIDEKLSQKKDQSIDGKAHVSIMIRPMGY